MPEAHNKPDYMLETPIEPSDLLREQTEGLDNQQVTPEELGWLAGIIDGEGYIGIQLEKIRKHSMVQRATVGLQISNTDEMIAIKTVFIMRKLGVNPYCKIDSAALRKSTKKTVYVVVVHRMKQLLKILKPVYPYLTGNKKFRADLIIEFCESRFKNFVWGSHTKSSYTDRELQLIEACLPLQKRGTSEAIRRADLEQSRFLRLKNESRHDPKNGRYCSYFKSDDMVHPFAKA